MNECKLNKRHMIVAIAAACAFLMPDLALAGVGVTPLDTMWNTLVLWTQSSLGKIITILIIVAGVAAGIMRQSLWAFVIGIGGGLGLYNAPTIINALFPAVL